MFIVYILVVKRRMISRCTIKLPKSGICPLCFCKTRQSNWARHVKRHHPEYTTPIFNDNNTLEQCEGEEGNEDPIPGSSKSAEVDLPMLQLEHFLNQQIQHNTSYFGGSEDKKYLGEGEEDEDVEQIRIVKELEGNNNEGEEYQAEAQKADEELFKRMYFSDSIIHF